MSKTFQFKFLKLGIVTLLLLCLLLLPRTSTFQSSPQELSLGILLDLLITIPVIYFFAIRKTKIPKFTVLYVFLAGLVAASVIIPPEYQHLLSKIKLLALPIIEIGVISLVFFKLMSLRRSLGKANDTDFYNNLLSACGEVFPGRIGKILATEIAVISYLFSFKRKTAKNESEFTYDKKSGSILVVSVFLFLISIETAAVHLLVSKCSITAAWVLSFLGLYMMLQIIAILRSMKKRLISIDLDRKVLHLRYGFACQTSIPFNSIKSIEKSQKSRDKDPSNVSLSLFDMIDTKNIIIFLQDENKLEKIYGIKKKYKSISFFVDERDHFVDKIEQIILSQQNN